MITHNEIVTVLGAALSLVVFMLGYWRGHYRAYAECCDCCTCETCVGSSPEDVFWSGDESGGRAAAASGLATMPDASAGPEHITRRHAILLEPGPTRYPELVALAQEAMDGTQSHPEPIESTWLRLQLVDWERRYPIPVGAP